MLSASSRMTRSDDFCDPSRSTSVCSGNARCPLPAAVITPLRTFIPRNYVRRALRSQASRRTDARSRTGAEDALGVDPANADIVRPHRRCSPAVTQQLVDRAAVRVPAE